MRRAFAFAFVLSLCATAVAAAPSCTSETTATAVPGCSTLEPSLAIVSPADGACVEVSGGDDAFIPVIVSTPNFLVRPPGTCSDCSNCGHVALTVNGLANNTSSTSVVDLLFSGNIASHYGDLELTVTLVDDDGNPWVFTPDGGTGSDAGKTTYGPLSQTVKITTKASCGSSSSSSSTSSSSGSTSSSSSTSASSSSSSSSSSGTGGTGGMGTGGVGTGGTGGVGTGGTGSVGTGGAGTGGADAG
jgi:hypothetical protein